MNYAQPQLQAPLECRSDEQELSGTQQGAGGGHALALVGCEPAARVQQVHGCQHVQVRLCVVVGSGGGLVVVVVG